jgi:thioredoxin 1
VSERHPDIVFGKVDTEDQPELSAAFNVMAIPTLLIFRENILVFAQPGALGEATLDDLIGRVRALDMDSVREAVAT